MLHVLLAHGREQELGEDGAENAKADVGPEQVGEPEEGPQAEERKEEGEGEAWKGGRVRGMRGIGAESERGVRACAR